MPDGQSDIIYYGLDLADYMMRERPAEHLDPSLARPEP